MVHVFVIHVQVYVSHVHANLIKIIRLANLLNNKIFCKYIVQHVDMSNLITVTGRLM